MHGRLIFFCGIILAFGAGWVAGVLAPRAFSPRLNTDWFVLSLPSETNGISYSAETIFKSDLSMPDVKSFGGSAKFVNDGTGDRSAVRFGYKVTVDVSNFNQAKGSNSLVPIKLFTLDSHRLVPIEPTYEARFCFMLKDEDGFDLLRLTSEPHSIKPGGTNSFQGLVGDTVPIGAASRTIEVILSLDVKKCL